MYSIIVPVYRNAESLAELITLLAKVDEEVQRRFNMPIEAVFVVDGSPDDSYAILEGLLPSAPFSSQLILHARNFGSFAAIRTGLKAARGPYFGMVAADLQEPPELLVSFIAALTTDECDIIIAKRTQRGDPTASRFFSNMFWAFYRAMVIPDIPEGGVDLFGCNEAVRKELVSFDEANTSLVGLVFWLGFRRKEIGYTRLPRKYGGSAWSLRKKFKYFADSVFAFTDLPIRLVTLLGVVGLVISVTLGLIIIVGKLLGDINVPGYAATVLIVMFFGTLNITGLGIVGGYVWRTYENTKRRPLAVVSRGRTFEGSAVNSSNAA
jgi:polyisoprenyl-phosphate glycosyltransferase